MIRIYKGLKCGFSSRLADELHSSTTPVYSYFSSIDDLKKQVLERGKKLMMTFSERGATLQ